MGMRRMAGWIAAAVTLAGSVMASGAPPVNAGGVPSPKFTAVGAGYAHTCALFSIGVVKCWGQNDKQLGLGDQIARGDGAGEMGDNLPAVALGTGRTATAIAVGNEHTCALLDTGAVKCWGEGHDGRLGLGDTSNRGDGPGEMGDSLPAVALGAGRTATAIAAGRDHTCALLDTGAVKCWGNGGAGALGLGDWNARGDGPGEMGDNLPAVSLGSGRTATAITAGSGFTCALLDNGAVKCWGANDLGQLGLGDTTWRGGTPQTTPADLAAVSLGTGRTATAISAGKNHACALLDDGALKCWGDTVDGQLGLGALGNRGDEPNEMGDNLAAVKLGTGRHATSVDAGAQHTCAVLDNAALKCWGRNSAGQLGLGNTTFRGGGGDQMGDTLPEVALGTGHSASIATVGGEHTCALLNGSTAIKCWGTNTSGQLGLGDINNRGAQANQMGDNLALVDLGSGKVPAVEVTLARTSAPEVLYGTSIAYEVTVRNTGTATLSRVAVTSTSVPGCARTLEPPFLAGASTSWTCTRATTTADLPSVTASVSVSSDQGAADVSDEVVTTVYAEHLLDGEVTIGLPSASSAWLGNGVYNSTARLQTRQGTVGSVSARWVTVRVQNDGRSPETLNVRAAGSSPLFSVSYWDGALNVTNAVVAGTYRIVDLAAGGTREIRVRVKPLPTTAVGSSVSATVTFSAVGSSVSDTVGFKITKTAGAGLQ